MDKKEFEMPKVEITVFVERDILTLSSENSGDIPSISW